jgi:hypothetical protein
MSSIADQIHSAARSHQRLLRGETIVLRDSAGETLATIDDAIVTADPATVGSIGEGPGEQDGLLRLAPEHHTDAKASLTAVVRGETWNIVHVADVVGGQFRVEIRLHQAEASGTHTNLFDLHGRQIPYAS